MSPVRPDPEKVSLRGRRGEGELTREAILRAAGDLLLETHSVDAVSIRAVADRVGLTAPTIYRYFEDKDHLLFEVCGSQFDAMQEKVIEPVLAATDDVLDALLQIGVGYARFGVENPELYRVLLMRHQDHTPEQYADLKLLERGAFASIIGLVTRGVDAGVLRGDLDPVLLAWTLWSMVHGIVALAVAKPNMPGPAIDDRVQAALGVLLYGALAPATT